MKSGMSEAIAMHRCGNLSKRSKRDLNALLLKATGLEGVTREEMMGGSPPPTPLERAAKMRAYAASLPISRQKKIDRLLKQAAELES